MEEPKDIAPSLKRRKFIKCWIARRQETYMYYLGILVEFEVLFVLFVAFYNYLGWNDLSGASARYSIVSTALTIVFQTLWLYIIRLGNDYIIYSIIKITKKNRRAELFEAYDLHVIAVKRKTRYLADGYQDELLRMKQKDCKEINIVKIFKLIRFKLKSDINHRGDNNAAQPLVDYANNAYNNLFRDDPKLDRIIEFYYHLYLSIDIKYSDALFGQEESESDKEAITHILSLSDVVKMTFGSIITAVIGVVIWWMTGRPF